MPDPLATPKTTMNVGVIRGGRSVNTIAPDAVFELDIRSVEPGNVEALLRECPAQYQWTYKRFKRFPPGGRKVYTR